jgi:small subunit ribosomal protein S12
VVVFSDGYSVRKDRPFMVTVHQIGGSPRTPRLYKNKRPHLNFCPQKAGACVKVFTTTPRKPNSALRKVARVALISTRRKLTAFIPGEGHTLQKHSRVLVRGGRIKDIPGSKYQLVRGKYDLGPVLNRETARSKYGIKKPKK